MKLKKLLALAAAIALLTGCAGVPQQGAEEPKNGTPVTVTDMTGREVTLEKPAKRIVALTAADCEILYAIGAGRLLVGRGEYCNWPDEVTELPSVQSGSETSAEQVLALSPDVIVMGTMNQTSEQARVFEDAGVKVVVSDAQDIEGVYTDIALIGALTGKNSEADEIIAGMKSTFEELKEASDAASAGKKPTVYFEVSPLEYGLWTAGKGTFLDEIAEICGLENAFSDVEGWVEASEEQVIERDPDYIVTITMYFGEGATPVEEIMSRTGWENLKAVKNAAVYNADSDEVSRPGPRLADAAKGLYDFVCGAEAEQAA